jgi:hypothetical protein
MKIGRRAAINRRRKESNETQSKDDDDATCIAYHGFAHTINTTTKRGRGATGGEEWGASGPARMEDGWNVLPPTSAPSFRAPNETTWLFPLIFILIVIVTMGLEPQICCQLSTAFAKLTSLASSSPPSLATESALAEPGEAWLLAHEMPAIQLAYSPVAAHPQTANLSQNTRCGHPRGEMMERTET